MFIYYTTTVGSVSEIDTGDVHCHSEVDAVPRILLGSTRCYNASRLIIVAVPLVSIVAVTGRQTRPLTTHVRRTIDGHVNVQMWVHCTVKQHSSVVNRRICGNI